jgi:4-amino-4-deoxy-L-arabinose transferase-like glycosyltransferase
MQNNLLKHFRAERWLTFFIFAHLICWTLIPALVRYNLPLDAIEGTIWGHQLEWGYDKNPFLNGWLTALATYLGGQSGWMIYLFSQLSVILCFWAVWQLAKNMLTPVHALISVMLLEGIQYYNFHAIDFNDNTLELSLWALAIYFFYKALRSPSSGSWILTGLFAGLGMMAKYYTASLLAAMTLFLFLHADSRKQLTTLPPYLGLITFLGIILPHTIWLFFHDFITINYVFKRAGSPPDWKNHFFFPAQFAWQQWEAFAPALILFTLLLIGKNPLPATPKTTFETKHETKLAPFDKAFLFYVGLGPFLLTILLSILLGIKLRAGWGMPLLSCWGIMLLAIAKPSVTKAKIHRFLTAIFLVMGTFLSGYTLSLIHSSNESSANFPGTEIAQLITQTWHDTYHTKLDFVGGSRWVSGNIGFYSVDHPAVFIEWDKRCAPWVDIKKMQQKGAVFVWDMTSNEKLPADIQATFPQLRKPAVLEFSWHRNKNLPPVRIGVALLPPGGSVMTAT